MPPFFRFTAAAVAPLLLPALAGALLALASPAHALVRLPAVLSDHMVLQRAASAPLWGWAAPGEAVSVTMGAQSRRIRADETGRWQVELDLRHASATPAILTVRGERNAIVIDDVLVGEVWLASGQSNMEKPLGEMRGQQPTLHAEAEIAAADFPDMRLFKVERRKSRQPADDVAGTWVRCSPASVDAIKFSAAAYFFGRRLHQALKTPVGLIDATWGGTRIEVWMPAAQAATAQAAFPDGKAEPGASLMFNAMIAPLAPLGIKGLLWYQGESNVIEVDDGARYTAKMEDLVRSWRALWRSDFPIYYVQLAPHRYSVVRRATVPDPESAPRLREAQTDALRIPGSGMVVTTDLADNLDDIHPRDKKTVGVRLANLALAGSYQRDDVATYGPVFRSIKIEGTQAVLGFDHAAGLAARDGLPLSFFEIAGADGVYHRASATIRGQQIAVRSADVAAPVAARFAWDEAAQPNLVNGAGLPALPFRSQHPIVFAQPR